MPQEKKLTEQQVIALERDLAKFATMMDSAVRIPFTKQGIGADAALSTIPIAGDVAGFALTCYAIYKAKQIGVPQHKLTPVIKLAVVDAVVGFVPVAGTIFDIFIRPSRKALDVVHTHIREEYAIQSDIHVVHPYLHEKLEKEAAELSFLAKSCCQLVMVAYSRFSRCACTAFNWISCLVGRKLSLEFLSNHVIKK